MQLKESTYNHYQISIRTVLLYIQKNITKDLQLEQLAKKVNMSTYHFHRVFRGVIGETLASYIRRLRLQHAAALLSSSSLSVTDIAFDAGYDAVESFIRAFNKQYDMSPSTFRKKSISFSELDIDEIIKKQMRNQTMSNVEVVKVNFGQVASVRHMGDYNTCCQAWEKLCKWAGPKGLIGPQTKYIGLCYDDPEVTPTDKIRYDASMTIANDVEVEEPVFIQTLQQEEYAKIIHKGPYENLNKTYELVCGQWIPSNNRLIKHVPSVELYLNDPTTTAPEELLTEIYVAFQ